MAGENVESELPSPEGQSIPMATWFGRLITAQYPGLSKAYERAVTSPPPTWMDQLPNIGQLVAQTYLSVSTQIAGLAVEWQKLPEWLREGLIAMAEAGWYLDLEMGNSEIVTFKDAMEGGGVDAANEEMENHFGSRLDAIHAYLVANFPARTPFFDAAFRAIAQDQHVLAIPVLFMQVDGICKDVGGADYFRSTNGAPNVSSYVLGNARSKLGSSFLCAFEKVRPVGLPGAARPADFDGLNRHAVLHGESLDYGTRTNSLKAVSLLNYVAQMLVEIVPESPDVNDAVTSDS